MGGNPIDVFQVNSWGGGKAQTDSVGYLFGINGLTSGSGKLWYDPTIRIRLDGATRYLVTSITENKLDLGDSSGGIDIGTATTGLALTGTYTTGIAVGTSGAPLTLGANASRLLSAYSTSALTTGAVNTMTVSQTMTAASTANQVEVAQFILTSDVKTGAWANAILAKIDYQNNGLAHGLAGVVCAELDLPYTTAFVRGEYALYEAEINCPTGCNMGGNPVSVFEVNLWGGGKAQVDSVGYLFDIDGFTAAADATKMISSVSLNELPASTIGIRIRVGGTVYYIPAVISTEWD
jgi:hypothetical protein